MVKIVSQNVWGLSDSSKRREIFHYFNVKDCEIILLQETHSNVSAERVWRAEWVVLRYRKSRLAQSQRCWLSIAVFFPVH